MIEMVPCYRSEDANVSERASNRQNGAMLEGILRIVSKMWKVTEMKLLFLAVIAAAAATKDKRIIFQGIDEKDHNLRSC